MINSENDSEILNGNKRLEEKFKIALAKFKRNLKDPQVSCIEWKNLNLQLISLSGESLFHETAECFVSKKVLEEYSCLYRFNFSRRSNASKFKELCRLFQEIFGIKDFFHEKHNDNNSCGDLYTSYSVYYIFNYGWVILCYSDSHLYLKFGSNLESFIEAAEAFCSLYAEETELKGDVNVLTQTNQGFALNSLGLGGESLERDNYDPKILVEYDKIVKDLNSSKPNGRIGIFSGVPGSGKTYLVKGLLQEIKNLIL
jgi:hypothetical protein